MVVFPNCKINLGLRILEKRSDGFHNLETVFYPIKFYDAVEVITTAEKETTCTTTGLSIQVQSNDNICTKAYYLLKKDFPHLQHIHIHLHKTIPAGGGLGGGSADGAAMLLLLNKKFSLCIAKGALLQYAAQLGSDCPFFIINAPSFATGRGEILEPLDIDLTNFRISIVNPGIHVNTGWAFAQINPYPSSSSIKEVVLGGIEHWKEKLTNDFEAPVFAQYPEIANIKTELYKAGAIYAALSGSGATVFGIFDKTSTPQLNFPPHYFIRHL